MGVAVTINWTTKEPSVSFGVRVPLSMRQELKAVAVEKGKSLNEALVTLLRAGLEEYRQQKKAKR